MSEEEMEWYEQQDLLSDITSRWEEIVKFIASKSISNMRENFLKNSDTLGIEVSDMSIVVDDDMMPVGTIFSMSMSK